jgi:DNA-binding transcriptional LysR family regulator
MLGDAGIVPNVSQMGAEISTLISLVDAHLGIAVLPASAVKNSVASVIACEIADQIPMSEIGIVVSKRVRAAVVDNFRSFALKKLRRPRNASHANRNCLQRECYCLCVIKQIVDHSLFAVATHRLFNA